jgi:ABC-type multidrug transport system fused ATPase/permease subunit
MTTTYIYALFQNLSTLLTGIVIAFIFEWRTALVALGLLPFLIAAGAIRMAFRTGSASKA